MIHQSHQYSFDKLEWWDMCRVIKPYLTWEEFEELWAGFLAYKHRKALN